MLYLNVLLDIIDLIYIDLINFLNYLVCILFIYFNNILIFKMFSFCWKLFYCLCLYSSGDDFFIFNILVKRDDDWISEVGSFYLVC